MAFNTRPRIGVFGQNDEENQPPAFDPSNPYGEPPPQNNDWFNRPGSMPRPQPMPSAGPPGSMPADNGVPRPIEPWMMDRPNVPIPRPITADMQFPPGYDNSVPRSAAPAPLPPPARPNRPMPRQMDMPEGGIDARGNPDVLMGSPNLLGKPAIREGENPYDNPEFRAKIARENPYNDANFNKPGGLRDQMRGKAYQDNDDMMDDVLMMEEMRKRGPDKGVTREIPKSWYQENFPNAGENRPMGRPKIRRDLDFDDGTEPYRVRNFRNDFDTTPRPRPEPRNNWDVDKLYKYKDNPTWELNDEMLQARKKGINPVPWERRNRAL